MSAQQFSPSTSTAPPPEALAARRPALHDSLALWLVRDMFRFAPGRILLSTVLQIAVTLVQAVAFAAIVLYATAAGAGHATVFGRPWNLDASPQRLTLFCLLTAAALVIAELTRYGAKLIQLHIIKDYEASILRRLLRSVYQRRAELTLEDGRLDEFIGKGPNLVARSALAIISAVVPAIIMLLAAGTLLLLDPLFLVVIALLGGIFLPAYRRVIRAARRATLAMRRNIKGFAVQKYNTLRLLRELPPGELPSGQLTDERWSEIDAELDAAGGTEVLDSYQGLLKSTARTTMVTGVLTILAIAVLLLHFGGLLLAGTATGSFVVQLVAVRHLFGGFQGVAQSYTKLHLHFPRLEAFLPALLRPCEPDPQPAMLPQPLRERTAVCPECDDYRRAARQCGRATDAQSAQHAARLHEFRSDQLRVLCIGGAPSSGTTLVADLIDSVPGLACPPEMYTFCIPDAYRFDQAFRDAACQGTPFEVPTRHSGRTRFYNPKYLAATGFDQASLNELIAASAEFPEFTQRMARRYGEFRQRDLWAFAEKTPINVNCAAQFAEHFPSDVFLHVVRDGRAVAASLIRRGYSLYEAALVWLEQIRVGRLAAALPQVIEVRYEDVVADPFHTISRIVRRVGIDAPAGLIEENYRQNAYRAQIRRVSTWTIPNFSGAVETVPSYRERLTLKNIAWLESLELIRLDASGAEVVSRFAEMLEHYGYPLDADASRQHVPLDRTPRIYLEYLQKTRNYARQSDLQLISAAHRRVAASQAAPKTAAPKTAA